MKAPDYVVAVLAKAKAGGVHGAELAALRRRLRQLGEEQAGRLPGGVLEPLTFGAGVTAVGDVRVIGPRHVPDGEVLGG